MVPQKTPNSQVVLKKNKAEGIILSDCKLYYKAMLIQIVWYQHKNQIHQPIEQNQETRNKPTHVWSTNI